MSDQSQEHDDGAPAPVPTLAEVNRHLFAAMLPETHALPDHADDEPKKPAARRHGAAAANEK